MKNNVFKILKEILKVCKECNEDTGGECLGGCCRFYDIEANARKIIREEYRKEKKTNEKI